MAQRVCIIGGGVIGLATAYALVRDGFEVTVIEARDALGSETSFANGGQLSYRYVAPLADAGVPLQAIGWMLRNFAILEEEPTPTLETYFRQCSIRVTCRDLALMGATLANGGVNPVTGVRAVAQQILERTATPMPVAVPPEALTELA